MAKKKKKKVAKNPVAKKKVAKKKVAKKKVAKKKVAKKKVAKKKTRVKVRPPISAAALVSSGVRMTASRQIYQNLLEELERSSPGMKHMLQQIVDVLSALRETEDVLADYGLKFYPEMKWPKTIAYWRKDLCRYTT